MDEIGRDTVFVSYSHADRPWLDRLLVLLSPLVRNRRMRVWADPHINVGDEWRRDLTGAIDRAGSAVLLVSGDFLASDFIMREELPALVAGGVRLAPILLRDCLWEHEPLLTSVQWAHDPGRDGPLDRGGDSPGDRDGRLVRVCRRLIEIVDIGTGFEPLVDKPGLWTATMPVEALTASARLGPVDGVPPLPTGYVERADLNQLRSALLATVSGAVGVTGNVAALGLHGQGGIGKSVLAAGVAVDPQVRACFPDGVHWVTVGERADVVAIQVDLLRRLGQPGAQVRSVSDGLRMLREALRSRRALVVVDDVWSDADAAAFRAAGPQGRVLYTTRDAQILNAVRADTHRVDVLTDPAARQLLIHMTGADVPAAELTRVLAASGRVPLALALLGAAVRSGLTWSRVADDLDRGSGTFLDHPFANTFKAMQVATAALPPDLRDAYLSLAVYPPDTAIPMQSVVRLWGQTRGLSRATVREHLVALAEAELLRVVGDQVTFHDLQHDYLLLQADDLSLLHADIVGAYKALLPDGGVSGWWRLPRDEPYIWDHLIHHLARTGNRRAVSGTATNLCFLVLRIASSGTHAAEADLASAETSGDGEARASWLRVWLARHAHLLGDLNSVGDVAVAVRCWLAVADPDLDLTELQPLLPAVFSDHQWGLAPLPATAERTFTTQSRCSRAVSFSPDGRLLASSGSADSSVRVWDVRSGNLHVQLDGMRKGVRSMQFSPDGHLLAMVDQERTRIWHVPTRQERPELTDRIGWTTMLQFSPGGKAMATVGDDRVVVRLWNLETGSVEHELPCLVGAIDAIAFSPDGDLLAVADSGQVRIWQVRTGHPRASIQHSVVYVQHLTFSPDGRLLVTVDRYTADARVWSTIDGRLVARVSDHRDDVTAAKFSSDGRMLLVAGESGAARLWDVAGWRVRADLVGNYGSIESAGFSPDDRLVATGCATGMVTLWDTAQGKQTAELPGHTNSVGALQFSPDGSLLATAGWEGTVRLWSVDAAARRELSTWRPGNRIALALSPDGQRLASADTGTGRVAIGRLGERRSWSELTGQIDNVSSVAFSPDGQTLAVVGGQGQGTVSLWDVASGDQVATLDGHLGQVTAVAFSPDGRLLASGGFEGAVWLWDGTSQTPVSTLAGHSSRITTIAFSPDSRMILSGGEDGRVRLWDAFTGRPGAELPRHPGGVTSAAFSPDGQLVAITGDEGRVCLTETGTGSPWFVLTGHTGCVKAATFSPDGWLLATTGDDGTLRLTDVKRRRQVHCLPLGQPAGALVWSPCYLAAATTRLVVFALATR